MKKTTSPLYVLVVTPLGEGGQGGIDRLMDEVRHRWATRAADAIDVEFATTRGQGHIALSALLVSRLLLRLTGGPFGRRPDVLHINLSSNGSALRKLCVSGVSRLLGIPYIIHLHGSGFRDYWDGSHPALAARIRAMFAHADRILVLGRVWRSFVQGRVPEAEARITVLPNAVPAPVDQPARPPGPVVILFLGHLGPRKGVPQLIEALAALPKELGWSAIIAGNGAVDETRAHLARLGLAERVSAPGWVGPAQVHALLAAADVLVLPSFEENLPMSVIEGMAYGLAVVTTPVGAVEDIIEDGVTGLLIPPGDSIALKHALLRTIEDRDLHGALGEAARRFHREHLEIGRYIDRLIAVWREVASAPSCPPPEKNPGS